jgi:hypothetical protein
MVNLGKYPIRRVRKYLNVKRFEKYIALKKKRWHITQINIGIDLYLDINEAINSGQLYDSQSGYPLGVLKDYCLVHITKLSIQGNIIVYPLLVKKLNERKVTVTFSAN